MTPFFSPFLLDSTIKTDIFDPLGANIYIDKSLCFALTNNLSKKLRSC
jgi:hypothetical protein